MRARRVDFVTKDGRTLTQAEALAECQSNEIPLEELTSGTVTQYLSTPYPNYPQRTGFIWEDLPPALRTKTGVNATQIAAQNTGALKEAKRRVLILEATVITLTARLDALESKQAAAAPSWPKYMDAKTRASKSRAFAFDPQER